MAYTTHNWAWSLPHLRPQQRLVLVAMADSSNDDGTLYPSVTSMAAKCAMSPRNLQRIIRQLEKLDLIHSTQRFRDDHGFSSRVYYMHLTTSPAEFLVLGDPARRGEKPEERRAASIALSERFQTALRALITNLHTYQTWFAPIRIMKLEPGGLLILKVPNTVFKDCLQASYADQILGACKTLDSKIRRFRLVTL